MARTAAIPAGEPHRRTYALGLGRHPVTQIAYTEATVEVSLNKSKMVTRRAQVRDRPAHSGAVSHISFAG